MTVTNIKSEQIKRRFNQLVKQYADELTNQKPSDAFKATAIYKGWQSDVSSWVMHRLDAEANKLGDLIIISDIKYNLFDDLSVNYVSMKGNDYDDLISKMALNTQK